MEEPVFGSDQEALTHYRTLAKNLQYDLDDTKAALDEFQVSSKELEAELEKDLATTEKQLKELRGREETLVHEVDQWKTKYQNALRDHTKTMTHMQGELESLRKSNEEYRTRLRDMELDNDELEGKERMVTSSLQDVESKYGKAIERITLLEDELIEHTRLEEECQRLRDDLRDLTEEMSVLRDQLATSHSAAPSRPDSQPLTPSTALSIANSPQSSPRTKDTCLMDTNVKLSRSPNHWLRSPVSKKPMPLSGAELTPRRRLISLSVNTTELKNSSAIPRSLTTTTLVKASSLRASRRSAEVKPTLHEVLSPSAQISTPATHSPGRGRTALGRDNSPMLSKISRATSINENVGNRNSHLQSLRAETQRMQGMTQRLVSSRTSRQVSAIPVPKSSTLLASALKSSQVLPSTLKRTTLARNPVKKQSIGANLVAAFKNAARNPPQPTTQDQEPPEVQVNDASRRLARRSQAPPPTKSRLARPVSRLSMTSDQLQPSQGPSRSITPACGGPRRKASIDSTERFSRPASTLGHHHPTHVRRQSSGVSGLHFTRPANLMHDDFTQLATPMTSNTRKALGKSLGPNALRPQIPTSK